MSGTRWLLEFLLFPGLLFTAAAGLLTAWVDRKVTALVQMRVGPPLLQPFYDLRKYFVKETCVPEGGATALFLLAPLVGFAGALLASMILWRALINPELTFIGDLIVLIYLLMMPALAVILGAAASRNPLASIGGSREMQLMMAYELPLVLVVLVPVIQAQFELVRVPITYRDHGPHRSALHAVHDAQFQVHAPLDVTEVLQRSAGNDLQVLLVHQANDRASDNDPLTRHHQALDDHAVPQRDDAGARQAVLVLPEPDACDFQFAARHVPVRPGLLELGDRGQVGLGQLRETRFLALQEPQAGLGARQFRLQLLVSQPQNGVLDGRDGFTAGDWRTDVRHAGQPAFHLCRQPGVVAADHRARHQRNGCDFLDRSLGDAHRRGPAHLGQDRAGSEHCGHRDRRHQQKRTEECVHGSSRLGNGVVRRLPLFVHAQQARQENQGE